MSQCLHCGKHCAEHAVFCDECQGQAKDLFQQEQPEQFAFSADFSPLTPAAFPTSQTGEGGKPLGAITAPFEPSEPFTEASPLLADSGLNSADQAVSRLSAAARWIAGEEPGESRLKRSARLTPLRDISADIQRASTPHPLQKRRSDFDTEPGSGVSEAVKQARNGHSASIWPWFEGHDDDDEKESNIWVNATDPLLVRSRPAIGKAAFIEEADIRRAQFEERDTLPYPAIGPKRRRFSRWHTAFASMVILAVIALAVDGMLLSFAFHHTGHSPSTLAGPPTLLLSTNLANAGDTVSVQLTHFPSMSSVSLTHDIQEALAIGSNQSLLKINASGSASASFSITTAWRPGFHLIVAEDVSTRDTASAMLQITGGGPSRPPHLLVDSASLDLGDAAQGADTIQPLALRNSGSGSITWSASSDQPWLLVAPVQGIFSDGQSISIGVQRSNLAPGVYNGNITIFSTVGAPDVIPVSMKVSTLPPNAGPMISLVPPLLAFTTTDGSLAPQTQVVTLSNPGQQTLNWSLNTGTTSTTTMQSTAQGSNTLLTPWLSTDLRSGALAAGKSEQIHVIVHSQNLLPGAYMVPLTFSAAQALGAFDNPQVMDVSLTIQPRCGLLTSTGLLNFTAVVGQNNPSNHAVGLTATSSCGNGTLGWRALSSAPWLTVSQQSGELKGTTGGVTSIAVTTANLKAGKYTGQVTFQAGKSTQTVVVLLNLQPQPAPSEPIMGASLLSLNFSTIQGQDNPAGQVVTITNNGGSALNWHTDVLALGTSWLDATPTGGTVPAGGTGQVTVNVATSDLTPGTYTGQVTLVATDSRGASASGSPQVITVGLTMQPPCTLAQPSSSALLFNAIAGGANPLQQTVTLTSSGSCVWPVRWRTSVSPAAPWLALARPTGALTTLTQQGSITVGVNTSGLAAGTYVTQVQIKAVDSTGVAVNSSPQTFSVTLTVLQPCTLQHVSGPIILNATAGQSTAVSQTFNLSETGSCSGGVAWTATGDSGSSSWLNLASTSGTDSGSGSTITVNASASQLAPGSYTGQITVSANNNGQVLQGSPQTIQVTFQVSGYTVSGMVAACGGPAPDCTSSQGLAGATLSLANGATTIATVTADSSGNFTFTNIPAGSYTITATGTANTLSYTGTVTVTVSGNTTGVSVSTFSS